MQNRPAEGPQVKAKSEVYREWIALEIEERKRIRREENALDQRDILRLEDESTAELRDLAQSIWEDYRVKHTALRAGDDEYNRALEKAGNGEPLWTQLAEDAIELARVLAVLWERGEAWSPDGPLVVPAV